MGTDVPAEDQEDGTDDIDIDMENDNDEFPEVDGWKFADSSGEEDDPTIGEIAKKRPEFQELKDLGLTDKPAGGSIGVHVDATMWRARAATGTTYGRSWGPTSGRTPKQALIRCLVLMWTAHCESNADDKLAHKILGRLRKMWDANPGKP